MSFAGLQVCPKRNLRNFEASSTPLRSHTEACSLMGFAGLQVCFQSKRSKIYKNSTERNKIIKLWKTCGKVPY